jgi:hypothetical protein
MKNNNKGTNYSNILVASSLSMGFGNVVYGAHELPGITEKYERYM